MGAKDGCQRMNTDTATHLDRMYQLRNFRSKEQIRQYFDAFERMAASNPPETLDQSLVERLLECLSDAECGGHGVIEQTFSYIRGVNAVVLARTLAHKFFYMTSAAPSCLTVLLVGVLLNERCAFEFMSIAKLWDHDSRRRAQEFIDNAKRETDLPLDVSLV